MCNEKYEHKSKYNIIEKPKSFIIHSNKKDRIDVEVELTNNYKFKVGSVKKGDSKWGWLNNTKFNMFEYSDMMHKISRLIMFEWDKPKGKKGWPGLYNWIVVQNEKALNSRVHEQWKRLLNTLDSKIVEAHRKCYHYLFKQPEILRDDKLYKHKQLTNDLINYRACAVVLQDRNYLGKQFYQKEMSETLKKDLQNDPNKKYSGDPALNQIWNETNTDKQFKLIENHWRDFLSDTGKVYNNLNKTIENMPGNLSANTISSLSQAHLKRPITNRLEFITALSPYGRRNYNYSLSLTEPMENMLMFTREKEIKKSIDIYNSCVEVTTGKLPLSNFYDRKIGYGKTAEIGRFVQFVLDRGDNFDKGIVGATQQAKNKFLHERQKAKNEFLLNKM